MGSKKSASRCLFDRGGWGSRAIWAMPIYGNNTFQKAMQTMSTMLTMVTMLTVLTMLTMLSLLTMLAV